MEKMKRILSFALCLCMLLSMSPLAALAEGEEISVETAEISEIVPEIEVVPEEIAIVELTEEEVSTEAEVVEEVPAEAEVEVPAEAEVVEEISAEAEAEVPAEAEVVEEAPVETETAEEILTEAAEEIPEEPAEEVIGGTCGEDLTWVLENGTLTISGSGRMNNYTRGTAPWYAYCSEITGVVFTGSVTYIGTFAFADCAALAQVNIDLTAVELGACAFDGTAVELPTSEEVEVAEEVIEETEAAEEVTEEVEAAEEVVEEAEAAEEVTEEVEVAEEVVEETEAAEDATEEVEVAEEVIEEAEAAEEATEEVEVVEEVVGETEIVEETAQETEASKEIAEEIEVAEDVPTQTEVDEEFVIEIEADDAVPAETEAAEIVEEAAEEVTAETEYNSEADTAPAEKTKEEPEAVIGGSPYNQVFVPGYKLPVSLMDEVVPTQAQAYNAMIALKSTYPEGYPLTDASFTYYWNGGIYTYGTGCAGFAFKLSDAAFGTLPARKVTPVSISSVHVGDILRINNDCHSVIILEVYSDHVVVAEGNYNSSVHWGRTLSASDVAAANYNMTRYPVGTFSGTTYTVSYNANGGDGAPSSQVKSKGEPIILSTAIPTRLFYEFKGWATSATATTATYQPGASYTKDASATLYAVWAKASYPKMVIGNNTATISNPGAYAAFQFTPSSTGTYVFQSDYDGDTMAVLYQSNGTQIADDDDSGNGYNFKITADLTSGQTYILTTQLWNEYLTDSFIVNVHKLTADEALTVSVNNPVNTESSIYVSWEPVSGAANYRVFVRTGSGSWTTAGTTANTYYAYTGATPGTRYSFYVRALKSDGSYLSTQNSNEVSIIRVEAPELVSATNTSSGIALRWNASRGAASYHIWRYIGSNRWTHLGSTTGTSYTVSGLTVGQEYTLAIEADASDDRASTSTFSNTETLVYTNGFDLPNPVLTSVSNVVGGVTVKWDAVPGAAKYRAYYKGGSVTSWTKAVDTTGTSATITGLTSGTKYSFTVRCLSADSSSFTSSYDSTGKSITYIAAPTVSSVANAANGVTVKWAAVPGAVNYRVFYKTATATGWTGFGNTTGTSMTVTGLTSGTQYFFTVRCLTADGKSYTSAYDTTGKSITYTPVQLAKPTVSSVANAVGGVTVKWGAISGATNYRVFYKTATATSWTGFGNTTGTSMTVTGLTSGTKYSFTVRCVSADGKSYTSSYDNTGKSLTYVAAPTVSSVANAVGGVTVKWGAVNGAVNYRVFYKTASASSWSKFGDTTGTSMTVTGLTSGTKYSFTVRCISADGSSFISSYDNTGKSLTYVATPTVSSVANAVDGVTVKWGAVSGAVNYRVFYKTASASGWSKFRDTTGTSMTVTGLTSGTKYSFTVRCVSADGSSFISSYDNTGKSLTYMAAPALSSVANAVGGVTVKWGAVNGAVNYRVFYKTASASGWTGFGNTTGTSMTVTGLTSGTKYSFTVRCVAADGKTFTSSYDSTGKSITYVAAPVISSLSNASNGVTVKWGAVSGAANYRVFYKTASASGWTGFGNTTGTSMTVTGLTSGTKYSFTVRCVSADGKSFTSSYDNTGKSITYTPTSGTVLSGKVGDNVTATLSSDGTLRLSGTGTTYDYYEDGTPWSNKEDGDKILRVVVGSGVTTIGANMFSDLENLQSVTFANTVTTLRGGCFANCRALTSVTLPTSLTVMDGYVFRGCYSLAKITLPDSLRYISGNPFTWDNVQITVSANHPYLEVVNGVLFQKVEKKLIYYPVGSASTSYTIPTGTKVVASEAFSSADNLKSISIPNTVETLETLCFGNCRGLTSLTVPASVTSFGSLGYSENLETVTFLGNAPAMYNNRTFANVGTVTIRYKSTASGWTSELKSSLQGDIIWSAY